MPQGFPNSGARQPLAPCSQGYVCMRVKSSCSAWPEPPHLPFFSIPPTQEEAAAQLRSCTGRELWGCAGVFGHVILTWGAVCPPCIPGSQPERKSCSCVHKDLFVTPVSVALFLSKKLLCQSPDVLGSESARLVIPAHSPHPASCILLSCCSLLSQPVMGGNTASRGGLSSW